MLGVQDKATEAETAWAALLPESEIVLGEFAALLTTVTLPLKFPAASGANVESRFADCPGDKIKPADTPLKV